jgi:hypothetical protein
MSSPDHPPHLGQIANLFLAAWGTSVILPFLVVYLSENGHSSLCVHAGWANKVHTSIFQQHALGQMLMQKRNRAIGEGGMD